MKNSKQPTQDLADWNNIADRYTQVIGGPDDRIYKQLEPVLWESLGNLEGLDVLDLGCGHGWLSGKLQAAGARVTGIDGSAKLLKKARAKHPEIPFVQHDLSAGLPATKAMFDHVVAHMVLTDIPVLDALVRDTLHAVKPKGKFIFTTPHPCSFNQKMRRDETGRPFRAVTGYHREEVWRIEGFGGQCHYHRSLTTYFDLLRTHNFTVSRLFEPQHIPAETEASFWRSIPVFILIEAATASSNSSR